MRTTRTNLYFDMEFTGLHQNTTLISLGIVSECGKTFYAELTDYDKSQIDDWLETYVLGNMKLGVNCLSRSRHSDNPVGKPTENSYSVKLKCDMVGLKLELKTWLAQFDEILMVSDCLAYDWVLWNQIWGHAFNIPAHVFYIPIDICTMFFMKGIDPDISRKEFSGMTEGAEKHNALWDAKVIKACYEKLTSNK